MKLRWNLGRYVDGSCFYLDFNFREGALRAITTFDELCSWLMIRRIGQQSRSAARVSACTFTFSIVVNGVKGRFRQEYPVPPVKPDVAEARRHSGLAKKNWCFSRYRQLCS
jgi:hypothetical protein